MHRTFRQLLLGAVLTSILVGACSSTTPTAPPSSGSPSPSPTASAAPTASPADPGVDGEAALDAFFTEVATTDDLSYHIHQVADLENEGQPLLTAEYELDVVGNDVSGSLTAGGAGLDVSLDLVLLGDQGWILVTGGDWTEVDPDDLDRDDIVDVWRYVAPRDDLTLDSVDSTGALHFTSTTPLPYETSSMRTSGLTGTITESELVLLPDGTPVELNLTIEAGGTVSGARVNLDGTTEVEFSNWGEDIVIEAPPA